MTAKEEEEKKLYEEKKAAMFQAINKMKTSKTNTGAYKNNGTVLSKFTSDQIARFMQNPSTHQKYLRQFSNYLYDVSPEYRLIIDHKATLPSFNYVLEPNFIIDKKTDMEAFQKAKLKASSEIDKLSLSHEMPKALKVAYREDIYYGYEHESKDSFFLQRIDADLCRISSREDGVFNYEFDFSYFDSHPEKLGFYPEEFSHKYARYKATKVNWIELDSSKSFAFKVNEDIEEYPLLPYAILFERILELDDSRRLQISRAKMDNFMLLTQQIPLNDNSQNMDDFLISLDTAMEFHNYAVSGLDNGIGFLTSPMEIKAIKTEKSNKDKDNVALATREIFNAAGVTQFLFNSDKNTSVGVGKSITADDQLTFFMLRQIERWLNRKLKKMPGKFKFKIRLLNMTSFDEGKMFESYLKGAQSGFPVIEEVAASHGISAVSLHNKVMIEDSDIGYQSKLKPLQTSHTQSATDSEDVGRDKVADDEATDSTIINRDANTDENKEY